MSATTPTRRSSVRLAVLVGALSGVMAHLPFVVLGRIGFESVAFGGLLCFFLGDPWLTLPLWVLARRGRLSPRDGAVAGATSGIVAGVLVALSMVSRGHGGSDLVATAIYPLLTTLFGVAAAGLGALSRGRRGR